MIPDSWLCAQLEQLATPEMLQSDIKVEAHTNPLRQHNQSFSEDMNVLEFLGFDEAQVHPCSYAGALR